MDSSASQYPPGDVTESNWAERRAQGFEWSTNLEWPLRGGEHGHSILQALRAKHGEPNVRLGQPLSSERNGPDARFYPGQLVGVYFKPVISFPKPDAVCSWPSDAALGARWEELTQAMAEAAEAGRTFPTEYQFELYAVQVLRLWRRAGSSADIVTAGELIQAVCGHYAVEQLDQLKPVIPDPQQAFAVAWRRLLSLPA